MLIKDGNIPINEQDYEQQRKDQLEAKAKRQKAEKTSQQVYKRE